MLTNTSKRDIHEKVLIFFSFLFLFILSRQVPFDSLSFLMNLSLGAIILLSFKDIINVMRKKKDLFVFFVIGLSILILAFFYSLFVENLLANVVRFFLVFFFLGLSYFVVLPRKVLLIFIYIFVFHALLLIIFSLYLSVFFTIDNYLPIRFFFQEKGWGDVFTYNGWFYRIQIKGNALLPVAFFVTFFSNIPRKKLIRIILFLGCIFAGNIAYILAIFFFLIVFYLKTKYINTLFQRMMILTFAFLISIYPAYKYFIKDTLELKNDSSLPTRVDQINLLIDDVSENPVFLTFGRGIGHTIEKVTPFRDYRGNVYFELQSLYVFNQLGILGFAILLFYNIYSSIRLYDIWLLFIYLCYIIYAVTNPYIFDTNHVVVILLLNIIQKNETKERHCCYHTI